MNKSNIITIGNSGTEIAETNYWETDQAKNGFFYLTWNAGAARLLVPEKLESAIRQMKTGRFVIIERVDMENIKALRITFDDNSDRPYTIFLDLRQCDREIKREKKEFIFSAWTKDGKQFELPGKII